MKSIFLGFILWIGSSVALANSSLYLFSENEIPVHKLSNTGSKVITTLKPGDTFSVLKWNNFQTRILLSDGREGYIERKFLENVIRSTTPEVLDPNNENREFLVKPLKLTITSDDTHLNPHGAIPAMATTIANTPTGNAESSTQSPKEDLTRSQDTQEDLPNQDSGEFDGNTDAESSQRENFSKMRRDRYSFLSQFGLTTWKNAIEERKVAKEFGSGYKSGNQSKGKCSEAVRESLVDSGLCQDFVGKPEYKAEAISTHRDGVFTKYCKGLHLYQDASKEKPLTVDDIQKAPGASVIVYSGYAGRKHHYHGHIEIKVPITAELKAKMGKDAANYDIGDYMYCSDFCRATPTKKKTNQIEAIYTLN